MSEFHFIRPWWLLALIPLIVIAMQAWKQKGHMSSWAQVCDAHLLAHLLKRDKQTSRHRAVLLICLCLLCVILSLSGPSWQRLPVPSYRQILPRVFLLDMSATMRANDVQPSRLARAKFKLHDAFTSQAGGQSALIAYTGEPFIVSPLTEDAKTIDALLEPLSSEIMPVQGNNLAEALQQAGQLIHQAGFHQGQILVLTAQPPSNEAIAVSKTLAKADIDTSILPVAKNATNPAYAQLASAGSGGGR